jgi:predicted dehydrogenase
MPDSSAVTSQPDGPRRLRLAIVGCGAISETGHIPAASRVADVCLTGLVDADLIRARALASRFNVPLVASALSEIADQVDAVILAAPPHVHRVLAEEAFDHGLHVLCEKPMANNVTECRQMLARAQEARCLLATAHTYRFFPNRMHAHDLYQTGRMGRMLAVEVEQGSPATWPSRTGYTLRRELVSGGVLFNEGVHTLDMLLWWFGRPGQFDYHDDSLGGLESNVRLTLRYPVEATACFRLSRTCRLRNRVEMRFEKGQMSFPIYDMSMLTVVDENGTATSLRFQPEPSDFLHAVAEQLRDFVRAVLAKRPPSVPGEAGMQIVEFIESCYGKARSRQLPRPIPEPGMTW